MSSELCTSCNNSSFLTCSLNNLQTLEVEKGDWREVKQKLAGLLKSKCIFRRIIVRTYPTYHGHYDASLLLCSSSFLAWQSRITSGRGLIPHAEITDFIGQRLSPTLISGQGGSCVQGSSISSLGGLQDGHEGLIGVQQGNPTAVCDFVLLVRQ